MHADGFGRTALDFTVQSHSWEAATILRNAGARAHGPPKGGKTKGGGYDSKGGKTKGGDGHKDPW